MLSAVRLDCQQQTQTYVISRLCWQLPQHPSKNVDNVDCMDTGATQEGLIVQQGELSLLKGRDGQQISSS